MDTSTRANGGLLPEPIARLRQSRRPSPKAIYSQLVDGDPQDKNPAHKPKDGDFTGPIQVTDNSYDHHEARGIHPRPRRHPGRPEHQATPCMARCST